MRVNIEVPRDLLALYLSGDGGDWVEAGHELRALLAKSELAEHCKQCAEVVKTWPESKRDCLGKIAAPVVERQADPVAWSYCPECGCEDLHHEHGEHKQCANCYQEWFSDTDYSEVVRGNLEKLKTSPPAPVALKDHEFRELVNRLRDTAVQYRDAEQLRERISSELRACIDKVKELNNGC